MMCQASITIDAPATTVWKVFADVERWPEWTESVTRLVALDGADIDVGNRFAIKQPRLPEAVWQVTDVNPGVGWTWVQRFPGGLTSARHDVVSLAPSRTRVDQSIEQHGPVGAVIGLIARRTTKRYLDLEARGLKTQSESHR